LPGDQKLTDDQVSTLTDIAVNIESSPLLKGVKESNPVFILLQGVSFKHFAYQYILREIGDVNLSTFTKKVNRARVVVRLAEGMGHGIIFLLGKANHWLYVKVAYFGCLFRLPISDVKSASSTE
jgi:hypothetical protein